MDPNTEEADVVNRKRYDHWRHRAAGEDVVFGSILVAMWPIVLLTCLDDSDDWAAFRAVSKVPREYWMAIKNLLRRPLVAVEAAS